MENEFKKFEQNPQFRPPILEKLYDALLGIPVSSVEAERCFSTTGNFSTKLRNSQCSSFFETQFILNIVLLSFVLKLH